MKHMTLENHELRIYNDYFLIFLASEKISGIMTSKGKLNNLVARLDPRKYYPTFYHNGCEYIFSLDYKDLTKPEIRLQNRLSRFSKKMLDNNAKNINLQA